MVARKPSKTRVGGPKPEESSVPPETIRRRLRSSAAILMMQESTAQLRNDVTSALSNAHAQRTRLPSEQAFREEHKTSPSGLALGRAKQVQYAINDALAPFRSFRSNFFDWVADQSSRPAQPRPPGFFRMGQRARVRFDYQDFTVERNRLLLPESLGLDALLLLNRDGTPLLNLGDTLVEVRLEPCRSRKWVHVDLVVRRAPKAAIVLRGGTLLVDWGVARLVTCLDDRNLLAFFVCGGVAKAILQRGAKWHAALRSEAATGSRHGHRKAGALALRSARQMEDLMKKVALLVVTYALTHGLKRVAVGRNKDWKQNVTMGKKGNQTFCFIPHAKLIDALRSKCLRAGIEFVETEESYTSKTDHLAKEAMGPKPEGYQWLGSRSPRGRFRSSIGLVLQADVNGCIGLGRKVGGEGWLEDFLRRLGTATGTRLVPRRVQLNGVAPAPSPGAGSRHPRLRSPRGWIPTKVALLQSGLVPAVGTSVALPTHNTQAFPVAA